MASKSYYYTERRHFIGNPVYILLFGAGVVQNEWGEDKFENTWFRQIYGVSYDLGRIESMMTKLGQMPDGWNKGEYFVIRAGQMLEELAQNAWMSEEEFTGDCYIVARGPVVEMVEDYLGIFKDKDDAIQYAEYVMSFEGTVDILVFEAVVDEVAPAGFNNEIMGDMFDDDYDDFI